jgi:hypothetical protein
VSGERKLLGSAPKILHTKAVSGGFEPVLVEPIQFVKLQERLQKISLTCHLIRISKNRMAETTSTPMLGCTNVFPNKKSRVSS